LIDQLWLKKQFLVKHRCGVEGPGPETQNLQNNHLPSRSGGWGANPKIGSVGRFTNRLCESPYRHQLQILTYASVIRCTHASVACYEYTCRYGLWRRTVSQQCMECVETVGVRGGCVY
jgi:hypothetical protein